jgi:hypothetical protein
MSESRFEVPNDLLNEAITLTHKARGLLREPLSASDARRLEELVGNMAGAIRAEPDRVDSAVETERARYAPYAAAEETAWPLHEVLRRLIEASEHLLDDRNCDSRGHEGYRHAINAARQIRAAMFARSAMPATHEAIERARAEGWRAGVEAAAKFHLDRAMFLAARVARLEASPDTVPDDIMPVLVEDWRDSSAQDRQDAYALRSMPVPVSMSDAVSRGEQGQRDRLDGLLKQMQERVELARANRDRSEEIVKEQAVEIQALRDEVSQASCAKVDGSTVAQARPGLPIG